MYKEIEKIIKELNSIKKELEDQYGMSYDDMYNCYLKNDEPLRHHIGVSYVEGMGSVINNLQRRIKKMEEK